MLEMTILDDEFSIVSYLELFFLSIIVWKSCMTLKILRGMGPKGPACNKFTGAKNSVTWKIAGDGPQVNYYVTNLPGLNLFL